MEKENKWNRASGILKTFLGIFLRQDLPAILYATLLVVLGAFSLIISTSKVQKSFYATKFCSSDRHMKRCDGIVGYGGVYRACLAHALFHVVLAAVTSEVWIFKKWREKIHEGFWGFKVFVLTVSIFLFLWIPSGTDFDKIFSYFSFVCGLVFTVIQMLVLLGIVNQWLDYLVPDLNFLSQESWRSSRFLLYHSIISILYLFSLLLLIYFFLLFAYHSFCRTNLIFLSYVLCHCLLLLVIAFFSRFRKDQSEKAIPETLACVLYVIFTSWLTMCSNTQVLCNPYIQEIKGQLPGVDGNAILSLVILSMIVCQVAYDPPLVLNKLKNFFSCEFREDSIRPNTNLSKKSPMKEPNTDESLEQENVDQRSYSYSGLHMLMSLSSFYVITSVTNWYQADINGGHVTYMTSTVAMFVLMSATFVCLWIYTWTLVKPVWLGVIGRFGDRIFGEEKMTDGVQTGLGSKTTGNVVNGIKSENETEFKVSEDMDATRETVKEVSSEEMNSKIAGKFYVESSALSMEPEIDKFLDRNDLKRNDKAADGREKKEKERNAKNEREMEMIKLQEKVLRLQDKIGKLQYKVATLQGVSL